LSERQDSTYDYRQDLWGGATLAPMICALMLLMTGGIGVERPHWLFFSALFFSAGMGLAIGGMKLDRFLGPRRVRPRVRIGCSLALCVIITGLAVWLLAISPLRAGGSAVLGLLVSGVVIAVSWAWRGRTERGPRCTACGYETGDMNNLPERCPECGALWLLAGGISLERRVRNPWLMGATAVVGVVLFVSLLGGQSVLPRVMPTPMLHQSIRESFSMSDSLFKRALARAETPEQQIALAAALIDRSAAGLHMFAAPQVWLEGVADSLPDDLRRRFYMEMADIRLLDRGRDADSGQRRIELAVERRGLGRGQLAFVVVGPILLDGEKIRAAESHYSAVITRRPVQAVIAAGEGPRAVTARVWLIVVPMAAGGLKEIQWSEEGEPVLPPSVLWVEEIPLRLEIGGAAGAGR
jgi:hypothetical protein